MEILLQTMWIDIILQGFFDIIRLSLLRLNQINTINLIKNAP